MTFLEAKNKIIIIFKYIFSHKKYLIILIVLLLMAIFKDYIKEINISDKLSNQLLNVKTVGNYGWIMKQDKNSYTINNLMQSKADDHYRLIMSIKMKTQNGNMISDYDEKIEDKEIISNNKDAQFKLYLSNNLGKKLFIDTVEIAQNNSVKNLQYVFTTDGEYQNMVIEKNNNEIISNMQIIDVSISRLSLEESQGLQDAIIGNTDYSKVIAESSFKKSQKIAEIYQSNNFIGQIFKARSDYISGVLFDIVIHKNGGLGEFQVELREAEMKDGKIIISDKLIDKESFNPIEAKINNRFYKNQFFFPLGQKINCGKYYAVGITSKNSETNLINHLSLYGYEDKDVYPDGDAVIVNDNKTKIIGDLSFKIFGAEYSVKDGVPMLSNSKIESIDKDKGKYSYYVKASHRSVLDIYESKIFDYGKEADSSLPIVPYYNNSDDTIEIPALSENYVIYKINTIYPYKTMSIDVVQPSKNYARGQVKYSYDGVNWYDMDTIEQYEEVSRFKTIVSSKSNTNELFVKISYDKLHQQVSNKNIFGIKELSIEGELIIN